MTTTTSRRAVLASVATLPALAAPALAATVPDPIFALIERHRAADAAVNNVPTDISDYDGDGLSRALCVALSDLTSTTPTTMAGCIALLRYVEAYSLECESELLFGDWRDPIRSNGECLLSRIASTLERVAVQS